MQPPSSFGAFQPAGKDYGATKEDKDPTVPVVKSSFIKGVAMGHTFLLFSVFIPPFMLSLQMAANTDVEFFVGTWSAKLAYLVMALMLLVPLAHLTTRLHPWVFLLTVWLPALAFIGIGWYYRDMTAGTLNALRSHDCAGYVEKRHLQSAYHSAQELYGVCGKFVTDSIEECPQYPKIFEQAPVDMTYLKGLERRFQCAGLCGSAKRLWEHAGASAPACSHFAAQWIWGGHMVAQFILWYSVLVILSSIPIFVVFLDGFFKDYYSPLSQK